MPASPIQRVCTALLKVDNKTTEMSEGQLMAVLRMHITLDKRVVVMYFKLAVEAGVLVSKDNGFYEIRWDKLYAF